MTEIKMNYRNILNTIPDNISLVVVSKTQSVESIKALYDEGHRHFGENRVQELVSKVTQLPPDISWHFIGHLQTNKVKQIVSIVHAIHSVDSLKLLMEINKEAKKAGRCIQCLLEFHIAEEESKFGLTNETVTVLLDSKEFKSLENIRIVGVMGMATFSDDTEKVRSEFRKLNEIFRYLKEKYFSQNSEFKEISMGMTLDYPLAIEEGSTMVRIGSAIFGDRNQ